MKKIKLSGPYKFSDSDSKSVFKNPKADLKGVYIWTTQYREKNLAYYVGETGISFSNRLQEHMDNYMSGNYQIYDPKLFTKGRRVHLWNPFINAPDSYKHRKGFDVEFVSIYPKIKDDIIEYIGLFDIFLLPISGEKRTIERVEAAIAGHLYSQSGMVGDFQEKNIRYRPKRESEHTINIEIVNPSKITGLCSCLEV